jgi:predicted ribosomally synthesized peptide with SipW-like signal peptide
MKPNKQMIKKSISKILIVLIFVGLNWTGFSAIDKTFAYFSDTENSNGNIYQAGTLDLSLRSGQSNFVPPEIANEMGPGDSVARDIYIKKEGSLPLQYDAHSESVLENCDLEFYNLLELKVWYNWYDDTGKQMDLKYDGLLRDFELTTDLDLQIPNIHSYYSNVFYGPNEHWLYFNISYPSGASELTGKQCQFKFAFEGWQTNLPDSSFGFSNSEEIYSTLIDSTFVEEELLIDNSNIVINEFLPIAGDYPEFIEFYNKGDVQLDMAGWVIENKDTTIIINSDILYGGTTSTIIEPEKWLVIDLSKVGENILDNTSDIITLYDDKDNEIDVASYVEANMVDKSYARIPDGSPNWVDPIPTPGAPNKLEEGDVEELEPESEIEPESEAIPEVQLEEITEEISLIATTTPMENSTTTSTTIANEPTTMATTTESLIEEVINSTTATSITSEEEPVAITVEPSVNENQEELNSNEEGALFEQIAEEQSCVEEIVVEEPTDEEPTNEEVIDEGQIIVDEQIIVETENQSAIEDQLVAVPDDNSSDADGVEESVSNDNTSSVENAEENSGDSSVDAGSESVSE